MLIDSHVHLNIFEASEREKQIDIARGLGTRTFIEMSISAESVTGVLDFAVSRDDSYLGVACHPNLIETYSKEKDLALFKKTIKENQKKVVCIGECGLDYSEADNQTAEKQRDLFRDMIRLAKEHSLPLNMHSDRLSTRDLLTILKEEKAYEVGGMMHNFGGNVEIAREYLDMGFYISVSVLIHHPMADRLRNVFREISLGQMVMDSDAPGAKLIRMGDSKEPYPFDMDKVSEPRMLRYIADKIAEVKEVPIEDVEMATTLNAERLFKISVQG
jgi:TatD DNase family protein